MELKTISFSPEDGWEGPLPAELDSPSTLVLAFAGTEFVDNPGPLLELASAFPSSHLMGCSTAGEILGDEIRDHGLVAAVVKFSRTALRLAGVPAATAAGSFAAGKALAEELRGPGLKAVFILSDGLHVNGSELVRGLNRGLPTGVTVTGGLAGDGPRFQRTWVLHGGRPVSGMVTALGVYGSDVRVTHGCKGGWDIFGPERVVTLSEGNVLYELDGKPALALYKEYLGSRAAELPASALLFPLSLREHAEDSKVVVRTILGVDEARGSMTFAGDIPQGWLAQLMRANYDRLVIGASESAAMAHAEGVDTGLAVAISCVGRRLVLGERAEEETEAGLSSFGKGMRQIGFYSYGEISPVFPDASCEFHNQTMTYTTFSEHG